MHHPPLDPAWLDRVYGLRPRAVQERMGGRMASVYRFADDATGGDFVARISDASHIPIKRVRQTHGLLAHVAAHGVSTPLPYRTRDGRSAAALAPDRVVEIAPYVPGRHPAAGCVADARRVGGALATFHNAGSDYLDLPGEEACDQNHVALGRLAAGLPKACAVVKGRSYADVFAEYVVDAEDLIEDVRHLRPRLPETCLHLDVSPGNVIFGDDGGVYFIDCSHAARGRRVFDVVTAAWYHDRAGAAEAGDPVRYAEPEPELQAAFHESYQARCVPPWRDAETEARALEHRLMLVHGAVYWALECTEEHAARELHGFLPRLREHHV